MSKPWSASRSGFEDTTRRRIEVRMAYLGLSHAALGARLGAVDGSEPLAGSTVRSYLSGRRAWRRSDPRGGPHPIQRFAQALGVPSASLEPGGAWTPLVMSPQINAGFCTHLAASLFPIAERKTCPDCGAALTAQEPRP